MKTNTLKRLLVFACAGVLIMCISVAATIAYFTDTTEVVTNTFTVGHVTITLDEAPVDGDGKETAGDRVQDNEYKLIPSKTYDKDPTVHVDEDSEPSYLFVTVVNGILDIESEDPALSIAGQMANADDGTYWAVVDAEKNLYCYCDADGKAKSVNPGEDAIVFETFTIDGVKAVTVREGETAPEGKYDIANYVSADNQNAMITINAYAVQSAGIPAETPLAEIWAATGFAL